ncbi:MAG: alpha-glucosidase/alpha-galactosidase [Sedimentisphaeraceae bacterium JB056]
MAKITFMGAGSTIFAKNVLGDCMLHPALSDSEIALYDIDPVRLEESKLMLDNINTNVNAGKACIKSYLGKENIKDALKDSQYVINAIQVGGYEPATVTDFEIPKKYGLRQTIADTLGIGGIFRSLRTIPVVLEFAEEIMNVCPDAWFLNYVNPMAIITGALLKGTGMKTIGLCHSVQDCVKNLFESLEMDLEGRNIEYFNAGINHMCWLLSITENGRDLYPEIKEKAAKIVSQARIKGNEKHSDMIRLEMMRHFGYYIAESSEHFAEYLPYWIKTTHPHLIEEFNIPLDEYPRRCRIQIEGWDKDKQEIIGDKSLTHEMSKEYGSRIINAIETDQPYKFWGNVINDNFIENLPSEAIVEIPCYADKSGINGIKTGKLPTQCAALNMTNVNVQLLAIEAALTLDREKVYQAAMLDPHTASELSLDEIVKLCDELFDAHAAYLPEYK